MRIPPVLRVMLRIGLGLLVAVPALTLILIGGGLLFLRSDTGERWVERVAAEHLPAALAGSGLSLHFGRISGPLPQQLRVTDLRVSDRQGVWLNVPEAAVRLRLAALLGGTLAVEEILVREPILYRLPELPESPDAPAPEPETEQGRVFARIGETGRGVSRILDRVRLDGVRLVDARIAPEALGLPPLGAASPAIAAGASQSGTNPPEKNSSGTNLSEPNPSEMNLSGANPTPDSREELPKAETFLAASLTGDGPLTDWRASLRAEWPHVARIAGEIFLGNKGEWLLPTSAPALPDPFRPDVGARLKLALRLAEPAPIPARADANDPDGDAPDLALSVLAGLDGAPDGTPLAVPELNLRLDGVRLDGALAAADTALQGKLALVLDDPDALTALMRRAARNGLPVPETTLPLNEATLTLALAGRPAAPDLTLDLQTRGLEVAQKHLDANASLRLQAAGLMAESAPPATAAPARDGVSGTPHAPDVHSAPDTPDTSDTPDERGARDARNNVPHAVAAGGQETPRAAPAGPIRPDPIHLNLDGVVSLSGLGTTPDALEINLAARLEKTGENVRLDTLSCRIDDDFATLAAQGSLNLADSASALTLRADIPALDRLPLRALLSLPEAPSGALNLTADLQTPGKNTASAGHLPLNLPPLAATLNLEGTGMNWGMPLLNNVLGKAPSLNVDLGLPPHTDQGAGQGRNAATARLSLAAAAARIRGEASLLAAPEPGGEAQIAAEARLNLPALTAFAPLVPDLSGSLAATLRAGGPASSPWLEMTATSPALRRAESALTDLRFLLRAANLPAPFGSAESGSGQKAAKAPRCDGTARLDAVISQHGLTPPKGSPIHLSTDWIVRPATSAAPGEVRLDRISGTAPGIALTGALDAELPRRAADPALAGHDENSAPPRLAGHLALDVSDWGLINAAAGLKGASRIQSKTAKLRVALADAPGQGVRAEVDLRELRAPETTLSHMRATLEADDIFGAARVNFNARSGPGTAAGRSWREGTARVSGPLSQLAAALSLKGQVEADLGLTLDAPGRVCRIDRLHARDGVTGLGLRLNAPLEASFRSENGGDALRVRGLDASLSPSGSVRGNALVSPEALDVDLSLNSLELGALRSLIDAPLPDAAITAEARLSRSAGRFPSGKLTVRADDIRYPGNETSPVAFRLDAALESSGPRPAGRAGGTGWPGLRARAALSGVGPSDLVAEALIPLEREIGPDGLPRPAMRRPLSGSARWEGSLAPLWSFVPLADRHVTGNAKLDAVLGGTLDAPELSADLGVSGGRYEDILLGLLLADINADLRVRSAGESRLSVTLGDGRSGTARVEGTIGPLAKGLPLDLKGVINDLAPLHRNDLSVTLSADASVTGAALSPSDLAVNAAVTVDRGEFNIVGTFGSNIPTLDVTTIPTAGAPDSPTVRKEEAETDNKAAGPLLNVDVTLPGRFFVRGKGLESEWRGDLAVKGPAPDPVVLGRISSVRGTFQLLGKEFTLSRGNVLFTGSTPPIPSLDIVLTHDGPSITAEATVSGPATSPALKLSSRPPLPEDEVVAQVLFGQSAGSLSRLEALQLANELRILAGGGPGLLGAARDTLGMDVVRFKSARRAQQPAGTNGAGQLNPGQRPGSDDDEDEGVPTLEVGKYVLDNVYVGLEQGMTGEDSGVRVQIELTPRLSLDASTTSRGSEIGASWKKDY